MRGERGREISFTHITRTTVWKSPLTIAQALGARPKASKCLERVLPWDPEKTPKSRGDTVQEVFEGSPESVGRVFFRTVSVTSWRLFGVSVQQALQGVFETFSAFRVQRAREMFLRGGLSLAPPTSRNSSQFQYCLRRRLCAESIAQSIRPAATHAMSLRVGKPIPPRARHVIPSGHAQGTEQHRPQKATRTRGRPAIKCVTLPTTNSPTHFSAHAIPPANPQPQPPSDPKPRPTQRPPPRPPRRTRHKPQNPEKPKYEKSRPKTGVPETRKAGQKAGKKGKNKK